MLTQSETIDTFLSPITQYRAIGILQKLLIKVSSKNSNDSLAATRLLSVLNDSDLASLLLNSVTRIKLVDLTESDYANISPVQDVIDAMLSYSNYVRNAVNEAKDFLPDQTVSILLDYINSGSPIDTLAAVCFMILAANLQD